MKILYLSNIPSPYRVEYFNELGKLCDLTVIYQGEFNSNLNSKWFSEKAKNFNAIFLKKGKINEKVIQISISKYINKKEYYLIIVSTYSNPTEMLSILLLRLKGIPFILEVDGGMPRNEESYLKKRIKTFFISSAEYWLSTSKVTDNYLIYYGAKKRRVYRYPFTSIRDNEVLPRPINDDKKIAIRRELGINHKKVAIAVGQLINRKGFDILINAWKNVESSSHLLIIGDGELKNEYDLMINDYGIKNITILDFMDKKQLINYYKAADFFVLPTREDIWGLVINEAMSNGLPVITTENCVAGLELVEDYENGFIIPVEDTNALLNKIRYLLDDNEVREKMALKNIKKISAYTIENMTREHVEIFQGILDRGR